MSQTTSSSAAPHASPHTSRGRWVLLALLTLAVLAGSLWTVLAGEKSDGGAPVDSYRVVKTYPHDRGAYTQGLVYIDDQLYEGTGQHGQSTLRLVDLETGKVRQNISMPQQLFGEGIVVWGDRIAQLTWRSGVAILYDRESFRRVGKVHYRGEGWGITHDGTHLIMSNGSSFLQFLDPKTFRVVRRIEVTDGRQAVRQLNELEYIDGEIYANVWMTDRIARIDPKTGRVTRWIDLSGLFPVRNRPDDQAVLNGIAYDAKGKRLLVTGKNWPKLFEIEIVEK